MYTSATLVYPIALKRQLLSSATGSLRICEASRGGRAGAAAFVVLITGEAEAAAVEAAGAEATAPTTSTTKESPLRTGTSRSSLA